MSASEMLTPPLLGGLFATLLNWKTAYLVVFGKKVEDSRLYLSRETRRRATRIANDEFDSWIGWKDGEPQWL